MACIHIARSRVTLMYIAQFIILLLRIKHQYNTLWFALILSNLKLFLEDRIS